MNSLLYVSFWLISILVWATAQSQTVICNNIILIGHDCSLFFVSKIKLDVLYNVTPLWTVLMCFYHDGEPSPRLSFSCNLLTG